MKQTDFGHIHYKQPTRIERPKGLEELAEVLKRYNDKNIPVTVRGSGNSMNGQSLTEGVQIDLSSLSWTRFDEERRTVTAGAGTTFHCIWQAIRFPQYSLPVFMAFPLQNVSIGGVLAAGGSGYYSVRGGGMWNWVESIKLVTMTGEILTCSRTENPEYFQYSLGGYGRIGVIGEVTLTVVPSPAHVSVMNIAYWQRATLIRNIVTASKDESIDGMVIGQGTVTFSWLPWLRFPMQSLMLLSEKADLQKDECARKYGGLITTYRNEFFKEEDGSVVTPLSKERLVYYTPSLKVQVTKDKKNIWLNIAVGVENYQKLNEAIDVIVKKHGLQHSMMHDTLPRWRAKAHFRIFGSVMKNVPRTDDFRFPLLMSTTEGEEYLFGMGLFFTVAERDVDRVTVAIQEVIQKTYEYGGKQYPCCYYYFGRGYLEQQYGKDILKTWEELKKELDPKRLLNIDVIVGRS